MEYAASGTALAALFASRSCGAFSLATGFTSKTRALALKKSGVSRRTWPVTMSMSRATGSCGRWRTITRLVGRAEARPTWITAPSRSITSAPSARV